MKQPLSPQMPAKIRNIIGSSGVDQAAQWPEGPKSPAIRHSTQEPYHLRTSQWSELLNLPTLGFNAFMVAMKAVTPDQSLHLQGMARYKIFSHQFGMKRLLVRGRLSAPYAFANYHFYEVCDYLSVWGALTDPATSGVYYPVDLKVAITGLA